MDKFVDIGDGTQYQLKYTNYVERPMNNIELNNEKYEGYMRSDFSQIKYRNIVTYDKLEVVRNV